MNGYDSKMNPWTYDAARPEPTSITAPERCVLEGALRESATKEVLKRQIRAVSAGCRPFVLFNESDVRQSVGWSDSPWSVGWLQNDRKLLKMPSQSRALHA